MDYLLGKMILDIKLLLCITILMVVLNTAGCENEVSTRNDNKCTNVIGCPCCLNATCNNTKICSEGCIIGYHGQKCINQCPVKCPSCTDHPNAFTNMSVYASRGYCTNCTDGFYSTDDLYQCQTPCPDGCKSCVSFNSTPENCNECNEGYYMVPPLVTTGTCVKCPDTCLNCNNILCETCRLGHYGDVCENNCSLGCDVSCEKDTGHCKCKNNFLGDKCNRCVPRKYGADCSINCIDNCEECDRFTGNCTLCVGSFNGSSCGSCIQGKYGGSCNQTCSENCKSLACDQYNGNCSFGCKENFSGVFCSECVLGKYGGDCDTLCPENCLNNTCEKDTGYCKHCIGQFNGSKCKDCIEGFHGVDCKINCTSENDQQREICQRLGKSIKENEGSQVGIIVGVSVSAVAVVIIIIGLLFIVRKRQTNSANASRFITPTGLCCSVAEDKIYENEPGSLYSVDATWNTREKDRIDTPRTDSSKEENTKQKIKITHHLDEEETEFDDAYEAEVEYKNSIQPVGLRQLASFVEAKSEELYKKEFQKLPKGMLKSSVDAESPENMSKNRYNSLYPYDETRVKLESPGSDFINACYINGYRKQKEYIASLGPTMKHMEHFVTFWRMVWQENTEKIVMVTNLMEQGNMKCEKYWPDVGCREVYGDVSVTCISEDSFAEYSVRILSVQKEDRIRRVHHVHFTAWPDKGVPDDVTSLIEFRQRVNKIDTTWNGKVIVHCSAGVGRTGTYIALDILTKQGTAEQSVDIFTCVSDLRHQRTTMVQTWEQYEYLHYALVHTLTLDCEAMTADRLQTYLASTTDIQMESEFKKFHDVKEKLTKDETDAIQRNKRMKRMNWKGADIPGDKHRVRLYKDRTTSDSDYINATYINGFKTKDKFIIAQTPMSRTVEDFLTMVVQEEVTCIVSMDSDMADGVYFPPDNQVQKYGMFSVRCSVVESNDSYVYRKITVVMETLYGKENISVDHVQSVHWDDCDPVPRSSALFLQMVNATEQKAQYGRVIVHCLNAAKRSGLFCAVSVLLSKMAEFHEVSVVNSLRQIRVRRRLAIPNKEQYRFCYQCICESLNSSDKSVYYNL